MNKRNSKSLCDIDAENCLENGEFTVTRNNIKQKPKTSLATLKLLKVENNEQ